MTAYYSAYRSSNGQPENGREQHTNKRAAIARAKALRGNLILYGGGCAYAGQDGNERLIYKWLEHAGSGYAATT